MLLNRFRGAPENDLKTTLTDIYNRTFSNSCVEIQNEFLTDLDEIKILEEIKQELIQEELDWQVNIYIYYTKLEKCKSNLYTEGSVA